MMVWTDATGRVTTTHYQPQDLPDDVKVGGIEITVIPEPPATQVGQTAVLYYEAGVLVYKLESRPLTPDEKLQKVQEEKAALEQKLAQLNGDFVAFTDFYFEKNPTQA